MSRFADFPVYLAMLALLGMLAFSAAKQLPPVPGVLNHTSGNVVLMSELEPNDYGIVERLWTAR